MTRYLVIHPIGGASLEGHARSAHRTLAGAIKAERAAQRACVRENGANTWLNLQVVAFDGTRRILTSEEVEQAEQILIRIRGES